MSASQIAFSSGIDGAVLSVLLDIRYPQAYLGLHPVVDFARSMKIEINLLPISVSTLKAPAARKERDDRGIKHRRHRALQIASEIGIYAESQGLVIREFYRAGDAGRLNLAWLWMRSHHPDQLLPFLIEAFRQYWAVELDPANQSAVVELVDRFGGDPAGFVSWSQGQGPRAAIVLADELRDIGVFAAPSYLVEGETFLGRQHLPMIRWMLKGRSGPVPI